MVQLILLIMGIVYAIRRAKIRIPDKVPPEMYGDYEEWLRREIRSIDIFLSATWGLFVISLVVALVLRGFPLELGLAFLGLMLLGLVISAVYGTRAAKLKKSLDRKARETASHGTP